MKVLLIHTRYKFKGGEDTVVEEEMKLLKANGVEVVLLSFDNAKNTLLNTLQMPFNFSAYQKTKKILQQFAPDVVHIHNIHFAASPSVLMAVQKYKIPIVFTVHNYRLLCPSAMLFHKGNLFLSSLKEKFPWKAIKEGVYKNSGWLTFWMAATVYVHQRAKTWQGVNKFITLSQYAKEIFLQSKLNLRSEQIVVKSNFASVPVPIAESRENYFVYVGRLSEEKGIRLLLNVFASFPYPVKIAGDGPLKEEVEAICQQQSHIEYVGALQKEEVISLISKASALVFPSIWFEGMPLTIIEAFACGTPVITSRLGAMEDMITPQYNGLHFEAGDEQSFHYALAQWQSLKDEEKLIYQQQARLTYEQQYTPQINAKLLLSIYQSVLPQPTFTGVTMAV